MPRSNTRSWRSMRRGGKSKHRSSGPGVERCTRAVGCVSVRSREQVHIFRKWTDGLDTGDQSQQYRLALDLRQYGLQWPPLQETVLVFAKGMVIIRCSCYSSLDHRNTCHVVQHSPKSPRSTKAFANIQGGAGMDVRICNLVSWD